MTHEAHIIVWQQRELRRCLIRHLLRLRLERGTEWLRGWVHGWARWPAIREDFWAQVRAGNTGDWGEWR